MEEPIKTGTCQFWQVRLKKRMNKAQWEDCKRPYFVLAAEEQYSQNDSGIVYYKTWLPLYQDHVIVVASTPYTRRILAGDLGITGAELEPVLRKEVTFVAPRDAQPEILKFAHGTVRIYMWDRHLTEATAQRYERVVPQLPLTCDTGK